MKFVLLVLAVLALCWLLGRSLRRRVPPPDAPSAPPRELQAMLSCAHCGVHLPRDEALPGRGGVFCDATHRAAFETEHPES